MAVKRKTGRPNRLLQGARKPLPAGRTSGHKRARRGETAGAAGNRSHGRSVAAIITAMNEEAGIGQVLDQLHHLVLNEIIVVVNGSTDGTWQKVRDHPTRPVMIHYHEALGHDVGRAVGARAAQSDILLFLDGDFPISSRKLLSFIRAAAAGTDVVLNNITPFLGKFGRRDSVTVVKEFLNRSLGRPDLHANSLTAVPHALTRKAVNTIGIERLAVPPVALAAALTNGLVVKAPISVDVIRPNRKRHWNTGKTNILADLIVGDHLEALYEIMETKGDRLAFPDGLRRRHAISSGGEAG